VRKEVIYIIHLYIYTKGKHTNKHKQTMYIAPKSIEESRHITAPEPIWGRYIRK